MTRELSLNIQEGQEIFLFQSVLYQPQDTPAMYLKEYWGLFLQR